MLALLDGLPAESWYKHAVVAAMDELKELTEQAYGQEVRSHIFAQLHGQTIEAATT